MPYSKIANHGNLLIGICLVVESKLSGLELWKRRWFIKFHKNLEMWLIFLYLFSERSRVVHAPLHKRWIWNFDLKTQSEQFCALFTSFICIRRELEIYIYRITSGDSRTFFNGNYVCHKQRRISLKLEHLSFKYLQLIAWDGKCVYYQQSSIFPLDSYWNKYMHLPLFSLHITKLTIMNMYFVHETEWYDKTHWSSPF